MTAVLEEEEKKTRRYSGEGKRDVFKDEEEDEQNKRTKRFDDDDESERAKKAERFYQVMLKEAQRLVCEELKEEDERKRGRKCVRGAGFPRRCEEIPLLARNRAARDV